MKHGSWRTPLLVLTILAAACGGPGDGPRTGSQAAWGPGQAWRVVPEAQVGASAGTDTVTLGRVVGVAIDPMRRVWIADAHRKQLLVFDAKGNHVRTIGSQGGGPGEFAEIAGMAWHPDGSLWVLDSGNARFSVYDTAGVPVRTEPRASTVKMSPWGGGFDTAGRLYDLGVQIEPDGTPAMSVLRSRRGERPGVLVLPAFKGDFFVAGASSGKTVTRLSVPYSPVQKWALAPDGHVWVASTAEYRIERHRFDGGVDHVVEKEIERVPVTREDRARVADENTAFTRAGGEIDLSRIPDHKPALAGFVVDDEGRLWVSPVLSAAEGTAVDVFGRDGGYLGRVPLPGRGMTIRAIRGDQLVAVAKDSLDVESVALFRIEKPAA